MSKMQSASLKLQMRGRWISCVGGEVECFHCMSTGFMWL